VASKERKNKLNIVRYPVSLTFGIIDDYVICDPSVEEENLHDSIFSVVVDSDKNLLGIIRPGGGGSNDESGVLEGSELKTCIERAKQRALSVLELIEKAHSSSKN
jgi:exosome complex RNA-binding protein Rrp42 (RNase PH superfamily)